MELLFIEMGKIVEGASLEGNTRVSSLAHTKFQMSIRCLHRDEEEAEEYMQLERSWLEIRIWEA